jgi:hypothetical protein
MRIDYMGPQGGALALAFAAGCVACFVFCVTIGRWIWSIIGRVKDDEIAALKNSMKEDRDRCAEMEVRLVQRIQTLEGFILSMAPPSLRQSMQIALSEQHLELDQLQGATA